MSKKQWTSEQLAELESVFGPRPELVTEYKWWAKLYIRILRLYPRRVADERLAQYDWDVAALHAALRRGFLPKY